MFITIFDVLKSNMVTYNLIFNDIHTGYDDVIIRYRGVFMADVEWSEKAKALLKAELKRRNIGYRELAERLETLGIRETERNIANKISRGGFTAAFLLQCLTAIDCHVLRLSDG